MAGDWQWAQFVFERCRELGMNKLRAEIVGHVGSFPKTCWAYASSIARRVGCSVRTVQRAIAQAKALGLIRTTSGKKDTTPPDAKEPSRFGYSIREIVGRKTRGRLEYFEAIAAQAASWVWHLGRRKQKPRSDVQLKERAARYERKRVEAAHYTHELEARAARDKQRLAEMSKQWAEEDAAKARHGPEG